MADIHVPIRPGTDIAFLGGLVRYILENEAYFKEYLLHYTNAPVLVHEDFRDTEELDGLFSGWDDHKGMYKPDSWRYKGEEPSAAAGAREMFTGEPHSERATQQSGEHKDMTLQSPHCVFQILKRHYARYTPENVAEICGITPAQLIAVAEQLCRNSGRERTSAFCYAVGWTQHTVGVQYIRTAAIVQLLLGNIGRPGGGIMALRGHSSIQGSTDIPTLYNLLPGYLPMPKSSSDQSLDRYIDNNKAEGGWWSEFPKYIVSLLKAYYGEAASKDNGYCFDYLPHLSGDHSHMTTVADMIDGKLKGYFVMGENPAVGSMNGAMQRKGLRNLEWLVVRDFQLIETAEFWYNAPEIERGEVQPEEIGTEVFFFPAANHVEKDGTFTNTQRLLQWHHKAVDPPGDCRSELHFMFHLGARLKQLYEPSILAKDRAIKDLTWDYPLKGAHREPDAEAVLKEINGYSVCDRKIVDDFKNLKDDGSTACGCWIYCGAFAGGENKTARRKPGSLQTWVAPDWGWAWPANRRMLYNRASADPDGKAWSERKKYVWWDQEKGHWTGHDNPDFISDRRPDYKPAEDAKGIDKIAGDAPFLMQADGLGWIYAPNGLLDGPLPSHYEPEESPVRNRLYGQQSNPSRMEWARRGNPYHKAWDDPRFPFVMTTYRLTEHHTAGGMSRWLPWLSELQPEMFCEVTPELARMRGLENGGWATITTARGEIEARVLVTHRLQPLRMEGRDYQQIGLPYHWGRSGPIKGDAANELISFLGDPNTSIQESKALTADIRAGRRGRTRRAATSGPLAAPADVKDHDLPRVAASRKEGSHHVVAPGSKQGEET
jgi:formate dehydrogenase major subunit